jgi:hypothetical protein
MGGREKEEGGRRSVGEANLFSSSAFLLVSFLLLVSLSHLLPLKFTKNKKLKTSYYRITKLQNYKITKLQNCLYPSVNHTSLTLNVTHTPFSPPTINTPLHLYTQSSCAIPAQEGRKPRNKKVIGWSKKKIERDRGKANDQVVPLLSHPLFLAPCSLLYRTHLQTRSLLPPLSLHISLLPVFLHLSHTHRTCTRRKERRE